ncbi:hypothetical protein GQR58_011837 [Nymphon striatum]|nr:hypothetical protein GQR58_011837 [Nymphon striatum]
MRSLCWGGVTISDEQVRFGTAAEGPKIEGPEKEMVGVMEIANGKSSRTGNSKSDLVRTVDTDLIVILIGKFYDIHEKHPEADIWTPFGMGRHFLLIHINNICTSLGERKIELYMMESKSIYVVDTTNKSVRLSYDYYFENIRKVNFESSVFFNIAGVVE